MQITRRRFLMTSSVALASSVWLRAVPVRAQQGPPAGFRNLRGPVGLFTGRGGTIGWLATEDALVVVDSQYPEPAEQCLAGLRDRSSHALDALINTHHHADHTAGNAVFRKAARRIVAHANVPRLQREAAGRRGTVDGQTYADTTFEESWNLDVGDEQVSARHHGPAHTGGDSVVHFPNANVVHMGDLVFNRWHPFIDRQAGASVQGWIVVLETVLKRFDDETLFVFGHGNERFGVTGRREDLRLQRDYFTALLDVTRKAIAADKSVEELTKQESLVGFDDHVAPGKTASLPTNLGVAYAELTEEDQS